MNPDVIADDVENRKVNALHQNAGILHKKGAGRSALLLIDKDEAGAYCRAAGYPIDLGVPDSLARVAVEHNKSDPGTLYAMK